MPTPHPERVEGCPHCSIKTRRRVRLALTWKDIDFSSGLLSVTKSCHDGWGNGGYRKIVEPPKTGSSMRLIPIPKQLLGILKSAKKEIGGTYVVGGDKLISVRSYRRTFTLLQEKLHIPHRGFHALRHTFATRARTSYFGILHMRSG